MVYVGSVVKNREKIYNPIECLEEFVVKLCWVREARYHFICGLLFYKSDSYKSTQKVSSFHRLKNSVKMRIRKEKK